MLMQKRIFGCVPSPRLVCSVRPEGPVLPCVDPSAPQAIPAVCIRRMGISLEPVGPLGQLGKEKTLPNAEDLFSRDGVGFVRSDSTSHAGMRSVGVELL